jgi:Icc-related predicted phosphoesterase
MRDITFISDTHGSHEDLSGKLNGGWMLICCGDISCYGESKEIRSFIKWLEGLPYEYKIFIAGNHDKALQEYGIFHFNLPSSVFYLQDNFIVIDGIKIYGSPYTPRFGKWYFMRDRGEDIKRKWMSIPDSIDILVTHGPPYRILDTAVIYKDRKPVGEEQVGCRDLAERIKEVKPKIVAFGHIHNNYGKKKSKGIRYINASSLDHEQRISNKPIVIDYDSI